MGFLDRYNPNATRRSATAWAIGGGIGGVLFCLFGWLRTDMPTWALFFMLPWMAACGALAGWATEWQTPSDSDGNAEQSTSDLEK
jgi:hypothetical protein